MQRPEQVQRRTPRVQRRPRREVLRRVVWVLRRAQVVLLLSDKPARLSDMAEGVTSVRLGELTEAVDREAALARRSRSEMIRYLIEDGLALRKHGVLRYGRGGSIQIDDGEPTPFGGMIWRERFEGCVSPDMGATYRVTRDHWDTEPEPMTRVIYDYELVSPGPQEPASPRRE